jgi:hypothetical protein
MQVTIDPDALIREARDTLLHFYDTFPVVPALVDAGDEELQTWKQRLTDALLLTKTARYVRQYAQHRATRFGEVSWDDPVYLEWRKTVSHFSNGLGLLRQMVEGLLDTKGEAKRYALVSGYSDSIHQLKFAIQSKEL